MDYGVGSFAFWDFGFLVVFGIFGFRMFGVCGFGMSDAGSLQFWDFGLLGVVGFRSCDFGSLAFLDFGFGEFVVFGFQSFGSFWILDFGLTRRKPWFIYFAGLCLTRRRRSSTT